MEKMNIDDMFRGPKRKRSIRRHRTYDVKITLNKSGSGRQVVRFGFINGAAQELGKKPFVEASDIEITKERIYFRTHDEKTSLNVHTLSSNGKTRQDSCYFTMTPTEKGEKMYRMNWINKTFMLYYDPEYELHYIDYREET